jgi:hypothetical protein
MRGAGSPLFFLSEGYYSQPLGTEYLVVGKSQKKPCSHEMTKKILCHPLKNF